MLARTLVVAVSACLSKELVTYGVKTPKMLFEKPNTKTIHHTLLEVSEDIHENSTNGQLRTEYGFGSAVVD
jgi:hypothetical protein